MFRLKVVMARKRRLRKNDGGDLGVHKQNDASSNTKSEIDVSNNLCGLELTRMTICNVD